MSDKYGLEDIPAFRRKKIASEMWDQVQSGAKNLKKGDSSKAVKQATSNVLKKTPDQFRVDVKMDRDVQSAKLANARRTGVAQPPSEFSVGRSQAKGMGAGLLKSIKNKMMKHLPGKLKKTY
tara:strand:- start:54 stop:419 length:366 start_codon:yes stop_codon:yes gene_type:complete